MTTQTFEARRTRSGRVVAVGPADQMEDELDHVVELVAPGAGHAYARIVGLGRTWTDDDGVEYRYGYVTLATEDAA
ncbi:MAG: hypothetical protein ACOH17_14215 [Cellulomonas sp.]